ncbi:hypothetical protein SAMN05216489_08535 [Streptomyces sp. 3213]|uniref:hypothetical protein n=1 Tax=Streptomyces sp. 3213.3 TaxID=1855348 RepID=UPI0008963E14|nr:hypothetical protein [Streptomyces sp. 3213.3]SEE83596.1 hypothetical protein SAMN05216489_08535 [Streptomyces sp. 3213] [Streptomyces sp. 3213.3]
MGDPEVRRALLVLGTLVPPVGCIPDVLTPSVSDGDLSDGLAKWRGPWASPCPVLATSSPSCGTEDWWRAAGRAGSYQQLRIEYTGDQLTA